MQPDQYTNQLDPVDAKWFAVYTNFRREKLVEKMLLQKGIECFLPLIEVTKRYNRKIRKTDQPLLSCYLFVKIVKDQYIPVLETEHVLKFIRFSKNLIAIPEGEIQTIRRVIGEQMAINLEAGLFGKGDLVEVIGGSLTGLKGRLVAKEGKKQFVIDLETIGYGMQIQIEEKYLRKLSGASANI